MALRGRIRSVLTMVWICANSAVIQTYQFLLYLLVKPISRTTYRKLMSDFLQSAWVHMVNIALPKTPLHFSGRLPSETSSVKIFISNHQADADWWLLWQVAMAQGKEGYLKIILKNSLKKVPLFGWGMYLFEFLFLKRNWVADKGRIYGKMHSFAEDKYPGWVVLFPEGTTVHQEALDKGNNFAEKNSRPTFEHLLLPRTTGFTAILDALKDCKPEIYDTTMAFTGYTGEIPTWNMGYGRKVDKNIPSLAKLFSGKSEGEWYLHLEKFTLDEIEDPAKWLDARWQEKERMLRHFAEHQSWPEDKFVGKAMPPRILEVPSGWPKLLRLWGFHIINTLLFPVLFLLFWPTFICVLIFAFVDRVLTKVDITNGAWPYLKGLVSGRMQWWPREEDEEE